METNPLLALWYALPPNVRQSYASAPEGLAAAYENLSTPGAIRDTVTGLQDTARSALSGEGWATAANLAKTAGAAIGVVPGGKLAVEGSKKIARGLLDVVPFAREEINRIVPAIRIKGTDDKIKIFAAKRGETHEQASELVPRHVYDDPSKYHFDDGFYDPVSKQYYTRNEMSGRMGPRESGELSDVQGGLLKWHLPEPGEQPPTGKWSW